MAAEPDLSPPAGGEVDDVQARDSGQNTTDAVAPRPLLLVAFVVAPPESPGAKRGARWWQSLGSGREAAFPRYPAASTMLLPLEETPEQTFARLLAVGQAELRAAVESGDASEVNATGLDGSLGTGRVWPSSDIDVTVVRASVQQANVRWTIRDGLMVHAHESPWPLLERLRDGYPQTFVDTAAGDWIRDPTWLLDGLASVRPVHDPHGRLAALKAFMIEHRFRPEVVEPRRPLLLAHSRKRAEAAQEQLARGEADTAVELAELGAEALAMIWLEADSRIISMKELDPELAGACAAAGAPDAHPLFRAAYGVDALERPRPDLLNAFHELLFAHSDWVDRLVPAFPTGDDELNWALLLQVNQRHHFWSARYALERGCLIHLAGVRRYVQELSVDHLQKIAAGWPDDDASPSSTGDGIYARVATARHRVLDAFPLPPLPDRLTALQALHDLTAHTFGG